MALILCMQLVIVVSLIMASRRRLENVLPVFCFFVVLMPLEARVVIPGIGDFNTMRVSLVTLLVLCLTHGSQVYKRAIPLKGLMSLHIFWVLCSTAYSISVATSIKQLIAQILEFYLMYYLFLRIITDVETIYKIIYAMMVALGLCCIFSLFEAYASWSILSIFPSNLWITYDGGHNPLYVEWGRGIRVRSTFPHPILFGVALAMGIPLSLFLLSVWERGRRRIVLWLAVVLMFWAIYKTSSRGPWIVVALSCVFLFAMVRNQVRRYLTCLALLVAIVLVVRPGIWHTISDLYEDTLNPTSVVGASYQYRYALNDAITKAVGKDPGRLLLGYGIGTFREKGLEINFQGASRRWYTCDDNWAVFLYETGYGGLLIMAYLLFKPLLMTLKSYRHLAHPERNLSGLFFIALASFYFSLLSVAGYSWGQQGYMAWILISLSIAYPAILSQSHDDPENVDESEGVEENYDLYVA